jgi:hypothetical protein
MCTAHVRIEEGMAVNLVDANYAALAAFLALLAAFNWCFVAALFLAHIWRIRSAAACLCLAENRRFFFAGCAGSKAAVGVAPFTAFFGGRPLRFVGP